MKKTRIVVSIAIMMILLAGCTLVPTSSFSPPGWIIGTWSDAYDINVYDFENDNVIFTSGVSSIDFAEAYSSATVTETSTSELYEISITSGGVDAGTYTFEKTAATTLNYSITTSGVTVGPLELIKE